MLVLVNFPWYNKRNTSFIDADHAYYRSLARRTFCGYLKDTTLMNAIVPKFASGETIFEVSRHLAGLIFIDDNSINENSYTCNVILNPNAQNMNGISIPYLESLVGNGDKRSIMDDLKWDNY